MGSYTGGAAGDGLFLVSLLKIWHLRYGELDRTELKNKYKFKSSVILSNTVQYSIKHSHNVL